MLFAWEEMFAVGVPEIDREHRRLVDMINEYYRSLGEGKGRKTVSEVLDELVGYTVRHFETEERLMEDSGYPELQEHRKEHELLKERVNLFLRELGEGGKGVPMRLAVFLREWLMDHIVTSDRLFGRHLVAGAVAAGSGRP